MFKIAVTLLMLVVIVCNALLGNIGGYVERPELLEHKTIQLLTTFAAGYLSTSQNLLLRNYRVIRVQTQLVKGINYKIDFVAEPVEGVSGQTTTCQVVINVSYDSVKSILQTQCQTA